MTTPIEHDEAQAMAAPGTPADPEQLSGRVIDYAVELVADGAESFAEDDLDEDGRFEEIEGGEDEDSDPHRDAIGLACDMAGMVKRHPGAFVAWYIEQRAAELAAQGQGA